MLNQFKIILLTTFILFALVLTASAQQARGKIEMGISESGIKLIGGNHDWCVINYATGLSGKYNFSERLTGQATFSLGWVRPRYWTSQNNKKYFKVHPTDKFRTYLYFWNVNLRYNILPNRRLNPYAGLGAGLTHWNMRDVSKEDNAFPIPESGESVSGAQLNSTILGMAGIEYYIQDFLCLDLAVRYSRLLDQDINNISPNLPDANNGLVEVRLGIGYHFGGFRDSDKDGIENKVDKEPKKPEDYDGFEDDDGAPDLDNDQDGIPDDKDEAPDLPEDIDGFQDQDGIPDLDNDNDNIPDSKDQAPNGPEDYDGFQDDDGIPDPDNDNDGIRDIDDQCPNEAETFNDYQDYDGCPDEKMETLVSFEEGKTLILPEISFTSGKAALNTLAKTELDKVVQTLKILMEVHIEIRGYTDSVGRDTYNLKLSQQRADAVKKYLTNQGIGPERLKSIGYGEKDPIAPNNTREGRAKNRRIEFILLEE